MVVLCRYLLMRGDLFSLTLWVGYFPSTFVNLIIDL